MGFMLFSTVDHRVPEAWRRSPTGLPATLSGIAGRLEAIVMNDDGLHHADSAGGGRLVAE